MSFQRVIIGQVEVRCMKHLCFLAVMLVLIASLTGCKKDTTDTDSFVSTQRDLLIANLSSFNDYVCSNETDLKSLAIGGLSYCMELESFAIGVSQPLREEAVQDRVVSVEMEQLYKTTSFDTKSERYIYDVCYMFEERGTRYNLVLNAAFFLSDGAFQLGGLSRKFDNLGTVQTDISSGETSSSTPVNIYDPIRDSIKPIIPDDYIPPIVPEHTFSESNPVESGTQQGESDLETSSALDDEGSEPVATSGSETSTSAETVTSDESSALSYMEQGGLV